MSSLDLALLSVIAVFALVGAFTGAARQVANLAAAVFAWFSAGPIGSRLGPVLAPSLKIPDGLGIVVGTVLAFIAVAVFVRWLLTLILRRLLAGRDPESRGLDRFLGFVFAGAKVSGVAWVMLCALTFVEDNVTVAGRRLGLSPKESHAFAFARSYNLFELTQFSPVRDLARVAKASRDPEKVEALKKDPEFQALAKDPRFRKAMEEKRLRAALAEGDYATLVKSSLVMQMVQDPQTVERLRRAADRLE